jgi:hypothetical protein
MLVVWEIEDVSHPHVPPMNASDVRKSRIVVDIWHSPNEHGRHGQNRWVSYLFGKLNGEKPVVDWIMATGIGVLWPETHDLEAERVERNDGWRCEPFV